MFSVEIRFRVGDREVPLERFATLFLKELLRSAQDEIRRQPAPLIPPTVVAAPVSTDRKELEPRAVGLIINRPHFCSASAKALLGSM